MTSVSVDVALAKSQGVKELEIMALAVNYHRWTQSVIQPYVGQRILEVGGGLGSLSQHWEDRERLVILDYDGTCTQHLRSRFRGRPNIRVFDGDILDPALPAQLVDERLDTVVCINVLEHIEHDRTALRHMYAALQPGGHLVLLVPAHPSLYGTLDELVGHYRRYAKSECIAKVAEAGFEVKLATYFNSLGAVGRFFIGRVRKQQSTGRGQVQFYDRYVVPVLQQVESRVSPPFGQSLIVVGRKV
jgi:SAM-dependent methyltransferase